MSNLESIIEEIKLKRDIIEDSKDKLLRVFIKDSIKSIQRYINSSNYTDEVIISSYDDIIVELCLRAYDNYKCKDDRVIQSKTQGQRSITYKDDLSKSPYEITTDIKKLLPGPFVDVL